jgi:hypothetical protein
MPGLHSKTSQNEVVEEAVQPEDKIFNKEDIVYFPPGRHVWRQQGPYVVCRDCELSHAVFIGMEKMMIGEDENGKPLLQKRDKVSI